MYRYGKRSMMNLSQAHTDLQRLFAKVIQHRDCSIIEGHRGMANQNKMFAEGKSKLKWPMSKHNTMPSYAVDVLFYPFTEWDDHKSWYEFVHFVQGVAVGMDIGVINGGLSWGWDFPHWELTRQD